MSWTDYAWRAGVALYLTTLYLALLLDIAEHFRPGAQLRRRERRIRRRHERDGLRERLPLLCRLRRHGWRELRDGTGTRMRDYCERCRHV